MNRIRSIVLACALSALFVPMMAVSMPACASAPANLSPAAVTAFKSHQVQTGLGLIRDVAVDANKQTPPLVSTATMRKVVMWHLSAIKIIHDVPNGWQSVLTTSLDELVKDLPSNERELLAPYVSLAKAVLKGAGNGQAFDRSRDSGNPGVDLWVAVVVPQAEPGRAGAGQRGSDRRLSVVVRS